MKEKYFEELFGLTVVIAIKKKSGEINEYQYERYVAHTAQMMEAAADELGVSRKQFEKEFLAFKDEKLESLKQEVAK